MGSTTRYRARRCSPRQASNSSRIESGYMQIRWNQQSSQGGKFAICEKKRLPPVAIAATTNAPQSS